MATTYALLGAKVDIPDGFAYNRYHSKYVQLAFSHESSVLNADLIITPSDQFPFRQVPSITLRDPTLDLCPCDLAYEKLISAALENPRSGVAYSHA